MDRMLRAMTETHLQGDGGAASPRSGNPHRPAARAIGNERAVAAVPEMI